MLMLLEAWDGITPFPECGILKAKKCSLRTVPTIQGQDSHFRFVKRCWNRTTVQTFSGWLHHHKKT